MAKRWCTVYLLLMLLVVGCRVGQEGMYAGHFPPSGVDSARYYQGRRIHDFAASLAPHTLNGSLIVEKEGAPLLQEAYGYASWEKQQAFRTETISHSAQLVQQFTAAAILKLAAQEKLSLTASLGQIFNNVPEDKQKITVDQLLRHTSGLPSDISTVKKPVTKEEFLQELWNQPLVATPGEEYHYSEAAYRLLAAVVEEAGRKNYEEYLRESLMKPAGLRNTGYLLSDEKRVSIAAALGENLNQEEALPAYKEMAPELWHIMGSSGLLTTVEDLHLWQKKLLSGKLLPPALRQRIWNAREGVPEGASAYGWVLEEGERGQPLLLHNSGQGSYRTQLYASPEEEIFISLLANKSNYQIERLSGQLARSLEEPEYSPAPVPFREQKFVRLPQGEEATHLRSLLQFVQEEGAAEPADLLTQSYDPVFIKSALHQQHLHALRSLRTLLEGTSLEKVSRTGSLYSLMLHQPEGDNWYLLQVGVESLAPYRLTMIDLRKTTPL